MLVGRSTFSRLSQPAPKTAMNAIAERRVMRARLVRARSRCLSRSRNMLVSILEAHAQCSFDLCRGGKCRLDTRVQAAIARTVDFRIHLATAVHIRLRD